MATSTPASTSSSSTSASDRQWVVDLENYGIDGSFKLKHLLTTCSDPIETIKEFQEKNGLKVRCILSDFCGPIPNVLLQLPTLKSAMKLLDLHNIRRTEFHEMVGLYNFMYCNVKVISDMSERLLSKLRSVGASGTKEAIGKLEQQLERSFKLYRVPKIRPIVLETLKQLPKVPDRYLKVIVADKEFYNSCAVSVRQQIWLKNDTLYLEAICPVIDSYIAAKNKILLTVDQTSLNFFTLETTKARRQWSQVQELISIVGEREQLYERLIDVIRERFLKTADVKYCSLRMELVMAAHDANVDTIIKMDVCHDFAWCLDACVRDKHLDAQQTSKLKNILESTKKFTPEMIADMAMVAADAHVVHFLSSMSVKVLKDTALNCSGHLPREVLSLQLLLRLLTLGASAHQIVSSKDASSAQLVDALVFTKFLSAMTSLIVEDLVRAELARAPAYREPWAHIITHRIVQSTPFENLLVNEEAAMCIIDDYMLSGLEIDKGMKYHLLRVINLHGTTIGEQRVRSLMERIAPDNIFEPGAIENEEDVRQFTAEYERIQAKLTDKTVVATAEAIAPTSPIAPVVTPLQAIAGAGDSVVQSSIT
ncbi:unnamed protein product [Anisakis simplex]|uniref:Cofactor of BRCA1 n=1 Tax=Anisakis simplex TaxID=6269 RepID=A0A0M3K319_ANISI|nr:unnamed protein product [Anisakis simplex]